MSIRRALALVVSLLAVWVGLAQPSAATATTSSAAVTTYTYDGHHHGAALTHTATERGPPVAAYNPNVTGVDGYEPTGTSVRPEVATDQTHTAYDLPVQLAPVALSTPTTQVDVRRTDGDLWSFQRRHVAANAGDDLIRLSTKDSWGNLKTLDDHFARHGADFGAASADDYARMGSEFFQRGGAQHLPTKIAPDGTIRMFDPATNTFGSFAPNGTTKTLFKPFTPDYWSRQPGVLQ